MMYGSLRRVSQRPKISVFQVGCFMRMMRVPSRRTTCLASTSVQERQAPRKVRIRNAMYVESLMVAEAMSWFSSLAFRPRET
jgi:hypothetical protein